MTTITTRAGLGSPLSNDQVDANFTNLNDDKVEASGDSMTGNLSFGDNNKVILGSGSDLQLYHDGTNSYIVNTTNDLIIGEDTRVRIKTPSLLVNNAADTENLLTATENGAVTLYYDNSVKLATTSTGIDVTGSVTADGLTVDGTEAVLFDIDKTVTTPHSDYNIAFINSDDDEFVFRIDAKPAGSLGSGHIKLFSESANRGAFIFATENGSSGVVPDRLKINYNGDISFYNDAGTSQDLYWDASTSRLGLGTTAPARDLHIVENDDWAQIRLEGNSSGGAEIMMGDSTTESKGRIQYVNASNYMRFDTNATERMRIDSSGNAIFTKAGGAYLQLKDASAVRGAINVETSDGLVFTTGSSFTERMRIDSSGVDVTGNLTVDAGSNGKIEFGNITTNYGRLYADSTGTFVGSVTADPLIFRTTNTERMRITSAGAIDVHGDAINQQTSAAWYIRNRVSGGSLNLGVETSAGALYYPITTSGTSNITVFRSATDEIARFLSNGNFGIGTDSATTILEIQDANAQLTIDSELSQFSRVVHQHNGTSVWTTGTRTASDYHIYRESGSGNVIIDQSSLGIGASSPADAITIGNGTSSSQGIGFVSTNTGNNYIHFGDSDSATAGKILYDHANDNVQFYTGGTLRGFYNANGLTVSVNTGGVSQTSHFLTYNENGGEIQLYDNNGQAATLLDQSSNATRLLELQNGSTMQVGLGGANTTGIVEFRSAGFDLAGVIDASANWVIGKSSIGVGTAGVELRNDGLLAATRSGSNVAVFRRLSSDGTIVDFQKDGATVGSIGNDSNNLYLVFSQANNIGLAGGGPATIFPVGNTGAVRDNAIDLGYSTGRFDDIYATNGTIQTSDRNEKQDIEALSDAEQRVAVACKGLLRKFRWKSAVEEKGDDARIHFGIIAQDLQDAFTAEGLDAGRYGMFINSTWTDDETGEERSRMGVRYSELLAFIISAI